MIEIDGRVFTYTIASDVIRDGLGAELNEVINGKEVFIAEVFRNDTKLKIEFSTFEASVPYYAIVKLFKIFESKVTQEFDRDSI